MFHSKRRHIMEVLLLLERLPRSVLVICPGEDVCGSPKKIWMAPGAWEKSPAVSFGDEFT